VLDAVVVGRDGRPVRGLQARDFDLREDGESVAIGRVDEVSAIGLAADRVGRSLVLLLDDSEVRATGTSVVQGIARMFLAGARPNDAVGVVRLNHRDDQPVGPLEMAVERVDQYRAKSLPFFGIESIEDLLDTVARISKRVGTMPPRRTAVVCIGGRAICDPYFVRPDYSLARRAWHDAIVESARANVAVYYVDPAGLVAHGLDLGGGLVDHTGGAAFVESNSFERAVDAIWDEAGHYYLIGYEPTTKPRDLHAIRLKVRPRDLRVRARLARGD
jgi:VWFA-related protein